MGILKMGHRNIVVAFVCISISGGVTATLFAFSLTCVCIFYVTLRKVSKNVETQLERLDPPAMTPFRSTYNPVNTNITVRDGIIDLQGNGRIICDFRLVEVVCKKLKDMEKESVYLEVYKKINLG